ncbi:Rv3235 family protein [Gryllotalpicola ginsengisoli]|uniref:Rv3235 family protein n=1 Tax=Gryllotalpicola ginsengisoli TaxID=444608 RepID=UPI0003B5D076|nr:Rv3235 family protein [Gryllotalpicola ginsengisoli]
MSPQSAAAQRSRIDTDEFFGVQRTTDLPDPAPLIANLTRCVIEIVAGARDLEQLSRWVTEGVYLGLMRRATFAARARSLKGVAPQRPRLVILSTHTCEPAPGVVEAAVVVQMPGRVRAVALRLEGLDRRWRATSISLL